ncbi:hypothetical protein IU450_35765 [Nocardia abscessus]|nr:hypothetical protein [Nocardia abscessus]
MTANGWFPPEGEVHVRIRLAGVVFDYTATTTAVRNLIHDWRRTHWCTIEFTRGNVEDCRPLTRLPRERLFLGP